MTEDYNNHPNEDETLDKAEANKGNEGSTIEDGIVDLDLNLPGATQGQVSFSETLASISESVKGIAQFASQIASSEAIKTLKETTRLMVEAMQIVNQVDFSTYLKPFIEFSKKISESLKDFYVPVLSDDEKEDMLQGYKSWGEYGWAVIPTSPFHFFEVAPDNIVDANKKAMSLCKKQDITYIRSEILEDKRVKKDFEEAMFCFDNKKYKACSMILFSLIEGHLVRLKGRHKDGNRRPVGAGAIKNIGRRTADEEVSFFILLRIQNLISCLEKMFENGNDFKLQPQVINRNFLDHGMLSRKVTKRDCIQLILVYYNLLQLMQIIYND